MESQHGGVVRGSNTSRLGDLVRWWTISLLISHGQFHWLCWLPHSVVGCPVTSRNKRTGVNSPALSFRLEAMKTLSGVFLVRSKPFAHGLDTGFLVSPWLLQSILPFLLGSLASFQMQQIVHAGVHCLLNLAVVIHLLWVVATGHFS